jgi:hypothetical protein
MKFKINRDHFAYGLAQVLNVVGSKATMPILSNVLIEAEKDQVSLTTTNLDLGIRCKIKAEVKEAGAVTLPVKRLANIVRELPNVDVSIDASPNHQVKLSSGGSNFRIMGIGKEEFPPLPEFGDEKAYTLEQAELTTMLRSVAYAQSTTKRGTFSTASTSISATANSRWSPPTAGAWPSSPRKWSAGGKRRSHHSAGQDRVRTRAPARQGRKGEDQLQRSPLRVPDRDQQGHQRSRGLDLPLLEGRRGQLSELPAGHPEGNAPAHQAGARALPAMCPSRRPRLLRKSQFGEAQAHEQPARNHGAKPGFRRSA